jgi:hypothetical protein
VRLRYADRARHIRNKPTVNRDPVTAQLAALRQQVARLEAENSMLKRAAAAQGKDPLGDLPEERSWQVGPVRALAMHAFVDVASRFKHTSSAALEKHSWQVCPLIHTEP